MKSIKVLLTSLFVIIVVAFSQGQESKTDKILMNNGEERVGKVTAINDQSVSFVYQGETLTYQIEKTKINKIEFSSGRIEFFNPVSKDEGSLAEHHNVVAVLPFSYISDVNKSMSDEMKTKVQGDCVSALREKAPNYTFQDPIATNAILGKHHITDKNITNYTPDEIAHVLNVEYVVYGSISVTKTGSRSTHGTYYNGKNKGKRNSGYAVGTGSTSTNFDTTVQLSIYNESGENIFLKSHESFWSSNDAYMITLNYIIKRSPFYTK